MEGDAEREDVGGGSALAVVVVGGREVEGFGGRVGEAGWGDLITNDSCLV